jgi:hypothetical protein
MERTIGRYSKLIKSKVLSGKNAGNTVEKLAIRSSIQFSIDIQKKLNLIKPNQTSLDEFYELSSSSPYNLDHQLWGPFCSADLLNNNTMLESVPVPIIGKELERYYFRSSGVSAVLVSKKLEISARALIDNHIYGSSMYRRIRKEYRRGNHYILFHASYKS